MDAREASRPPADSTGSGLPMDVIFDLLRVERRRLTLRYLRQDGPDASLSTLATWIAARENDIPIGTVASEQRKRVYIALYQSHLPKMDDADVVDFDSRAGAVVLAGNASVLYPYLDLGRADAGPSTAPTGPWAAINRLCARIGIGSRSSYRADTSREYPATTPETRPGQ